MQSTSPLQKRQNIFWRNRFVLLAVLMTAGVMSVIYLCASFALFHGENTILRIDLYHQYAPLFAELYDRLFAHQSLTYSWTTGLGSCFLGNYFNYLSSPIGAIVVFFGHKHVPEAIAAMVLIKAALSSGTFAWYLKRSQRSHTPVIAAFGLLYSFCGFMLAYYWDVMWLDAMVLLPLVVRGIEQIIDRRRFALFTGALALSMFSNYYMSYMLCLFSVLYFFYYFFSRYTLLDCVNQKRFSPGNAFSLRLLRAGLVFTFAALLAAALMAAALLPTYRILQSCSATSGITPKEWKTYFNFFDFFANHFALLTPTIRSSETVVLPNIYCGVLTLLLAPLYFFTKSVSKREKTVTLFLLAIFYVSFNYNIINFYWHGMHFPNDLPYRFSFIYSFLLLVIAYKTFRRLRELETRWIALSCIFVFAFLVLVEDAGSHNVTDKTVLWTSVFLVIQGLLLILFRSGRTFALSLSMLLCVFTCSEAIICDTPAFLLDNPVKQESYEGDYDEFRGLKEKLDTIEQGDFYRMELSQLRARMDNSWFGYNGVSTFSSMAYERMAKLEYSLGMMSNHINSYTYHPQTPVYNMMHALKYVVSNTSPNLLVSPHYAYTTDNGKFLAYRVKENLPIAYGVNSDIENWNTELTNPFAMQTDYFLRATGLDGSLFTIAPADYVNYFNCEPFATDLETTEFYFTKTSAGQEASANFHVVAPKKGNLYFYFKVSGASSKSVTVNTNNGTLTHSARENCIFDLGYYEKGEEVNITIPFETDSGSLTFEVCTMDEKLFAEGYEILSERALLLTDFTNDLRKTSLTGTFITAEDCVLYTSIPYDTGWVVTIDGETVPQDEIFAIGNGLLGVRVGRGSHTVQLTYHAPGLRIGLIISGAAALLALLLAVGYLIRKRLRIKKRLANGERVLLAGRDAPVSEDLFLAPPAPKPANAPAPPAPPAQQASAKAAPPAGAPKREIITPPRQQVRREVIGVPAPPASEVPTVTPPQYDVTELAPFDE
ncbi:MAG: YfhO family protein [Clostridia bacterium]|nr:YfhO family protein [Clostridia bacterium]